MVDRPAVHYARTGDDVHIAFQSLGVGRSDILFVPGQLTHLDLRWEMPDDVRWLTSVAQLGRLVVLDRRGVGLSDRLSPGDLPSAEVLASDLDAVIEAARLERPVLFGFAEGAQIAAFYAAMHPERISGLVVYALWSHTPEADRSDWEMYIDWACDDWGSTQIAQATVRDIWPSRANDADFVASIARLQRAAVSPGATRPLFEADMELDVRGVLPTLSIPTLVLIREHDSAIDPELLTETASLIPHARHVVLPGHDHWYSSDPQEPMLDAVEAFLNEIQGVRTTPNRRLATVLFTDLVDSTQMAASAGDTAWVKLLHEHNEIVRHHLAVFDGTEVDTAGDGFFATFDGPARAVRCALSIISELSARGLRVRVGIHVGEVESVDGKIAGVGVVIGARVAALAGPNQILVTRTVKELTAGSGLTFEPAGEHELKGLPERWTLFGVAAEPRSPLTTP